MIDPLLVAACALEVVNGATLATLALAAVVSWVKGA